LSPELVERLKAIIEQSARRDHEALTEQARINLDQNPPGMWHLTATGHDGSIVAYGQASLVGDTLDMQLLNDLWDPRFDELLAEVELDAHPLTIWRHGATTKPQIPDGFTVDRILRYLARPLPALQAQQTDYSLRSFIVGRDEAPWLEINAKAFAHHPEQGNWTIDDLEQRMNASWFDPALFLILADGYDVIGFCWVKVEDHYPQRGEIYVIGVDPDYTGKGLGQFLVLSGLEAMARRGASEAMLYVEDTNVGALKLYDALGFVERSRDYRFIRSR
jgi:mycothiol synthase